MQSDTADGRANARDPRALVSAHAPSAERRPAAPRPLASFVAQLFACETQLEPFRRHRRAGPEQARACYDTQPQEPRSPVRFERML